MREYFDLRAIEIPAGIPDDEVEIIAGVGYWAGEVYPEMAENWLDKYNNSERSELIQRPSSVRNIEYLARQIGEGKWIKDHPDHLCFTRAPGYFSNGVHRLQAIVRAGRPAFLRIMIGTAASSFNYIDTGRPRHAADVLAAISGREGIVYPRTVAGIIRFAINYKRGNYIALVKAHGHAISNDEVVLFYRENKTVVNTAARAHKIYREADREDQIVTPRVIGGLSWLAQDAGHPPESVWAFFERLLSPTTQAEYGDPVRVVYERLRGARMSELITGVYLERISIIIVGMNNYLFNRKTKIIKPNNFPNIMARIDAA